MGPGSTSAHSLDSMATLAPFTLPGMNSFMAGIPHLEEDGSNWAIFSTRFWEAMQAAGRWVLRTPTAIGHLSGTPLLLFHVRRYCLCCCCSLYDTRRLNCLALRYKSLTGFLVISDIMVQPSGFLGVPVSRLFRTLLSFMVLPLLHPL
jgi:hypothetical protein